MKILTFILLILSNTLFAWPESHLHQRYSFRGNELPDSDNQTGKELQFALFNGKGVWSTGREHLKMFLKEYGYSYQVINANDVLDGFLEKENPATLIMPGGESWEYLAELGSPGAEQIKKFVRKGGGYIGICAGAFYAVSERLGGHATGKYGIGLLKGTAYDGTAFQTPPFIEGMMDFQLTSSSLLHSLQEKFRIVLFGGPSIRYSKKEARRKKLQVLSKFQKIGEAAMVLFQYGKGKVYLSAPHLEIEEDRTDWGAKFKDPDSEWPILQRVANELLLANKLAH